MSDVQCQKIFIRREQRLLDKSNAYSEGFAQCCVAVGISGFLSDALLSSIPKRICRTLDLFSLQL